jgi:4-alpha-glucanotransferase
MLAVTAQESVRNQCLVIGEDLGTIPEGVREAFNDWGIWSYRVALFEREPDGLFRLPENFPDKSIVTFSTHDLPTLVGWTSSRDLEVRSALGMNAGEDRSQRDEAVKQMQRTLERHSIKSDLSLLCILEYLAQARSALLAVSIEDILELADQPNVPGTVTEYDNWRLRLPIEVEELREHDLLHRVGFLLAKHGRASGKIH